MRSWKHSIWALSLLLGGCKGDNSTAVLIEQPVTARPIVAVVPVMDRSRHELSWNVSHELTAALRQRLGQHGTLYLLSEDQVYAMSRKSSQGRDPFGSETAWVKKGYPQNEFVAFFELVEHREMSLEGVAKIHRSEKSMILDPLERQGDALPLCSDGGLPSRAGEEERIQEGSKGRFYTRKNFATPSLGEESPAELTVSMRVRVFDLRGEAPKVVLEEIVEQSHHIPKQFTRNQFNQVPWGDEMFEISPLGIAHGKLCQELASRVEDYILLSCKN